MRCVHSLFSAWYSSVRRTIEHGAEDRVSRAAAGRDDDALARADVHRARSLLVVVVDIDDRDAGDASRGRALAVDFGHLLLEQDLDAHLARGLGQRPHEPGTARRAGHFVRPMHDVQPRARAIETVRIGAIAFPSDAVLLQPAEQVEIVVGIGAHELAVGKTAHRLVGARPVFEHLVRRIVLAELAALLEPVAAADIEPAEAHHRAPADVEILLDDDDRGALLARGDGGHETARTAADDDDVRLAIPGDGVCGLRRLRLHRANRDGTGRSTRSEEVAPPRRVEVCTRLARGFGHVRLLPMDSLRL